MRPNLPMKLTVRCATRRLSAIRCSLRNDQRVLAVLKRQL